MTELPPGHDELNELANLSPNTPVAPAHGIAAIALSMAMKYHDINTVQDGVLYQQYKMEGKNLRGLHLDEVLETATKIEMWLLGASQRIAKLVIDAVMSPEMQDDAQGIEARQGEDPSSGLHPKDESPVAEGDAP